VETLTPFAVSVALATETANAQPGVPIAAVGTAGTLAKGRGRPVRAALQVRNRDTKLGQHGSGLGEPGGISRHSRPAMRMWSWWTSRPTVATGWITTTPCDG
jgi:hypothetical protein